MAAPSSYRVLDAARVVASLETLENRIRERFPEAGLAKVCAELNQLARESRARARRIERRNIPLRIGIVVLLGACLLLIAKVGMLIDFSKTSADSVYTVLQGIEATMNIVVLMGASVWSFITLEERLKRRRAISALHELRSIVHVIDMHQLTKDPSAASRDASQQTPSSPARTLTPFELTRYLDYCSEMLSLAAKVAVIYAQSLPDQVVNDAATELEQVATNLSQKIWQKITIVHAAIAADTASGSAASHPSSAPASTGTAAGAPTAPTTGEHA